MTENFIDKIIQQDLRFGRQVITRFPPEPNGFLHLGHLKSIYVNFSIASRYKGACLLRFDDTNPATTTQFACDNIYQDLLALGFSPAKKSYASDYFPFYNDCATFLIKQGLAYVCFLNQATTAAWRGTLKEGGKDSPYRNVAPQENLQYFKLMRSGFYAAGSCSLRLKIDMNHSNINLRDPIIYRIKSEEHFRTGKNHIYPSYDFAQVLADIKDEVTHSIASKEFETNKTLYDWLIEALHPFLQHSYYPQQIEFARLDFIEKEAVVSKRKLQELIELNVVAGLGDPRLFTIKGLFARGYTPTSLVRFASNLGISKQESKISTTELRRSLRAELDPEASRKHLVEDPLILEITSKAVAYVVTANHPKNCSLGFRSVTAGKKLYIEAADVSLTLAPGVKKITPQAYFSLISLGYFYCTEIIVNNKGEVEKVCCTATSKPEKKAVASVQWVSAQDGVDVTIKRFNGMQIEYSKAKAEASISQLRSFFQAYRKGYYAPPSKGVIQEIVPLVK